MEPELVFRMWKRVDAEANSFREAIRIMDEEILRFVREHPDLVRAIVPDRRTTRAVEARGSQIHEYWYRGRRIGTPFPDIGQW
jgi:hypothetical protein